MKKILLLASVLVLQAMLLGQSQDLAKLASGDYLGLNALFDKDEKLFGYFSLYRYGKENDASKKFEYVIMDKNLNPIANKEFSAEVSANSYYAYMDFNNKIILQPRGIDANLWNYRKIALPMSKEIDLKTNTIKTKEYFKYKGGKFIKVDQPTTYKENSDEARTEKRELGYNYISSVFEIKEGGFMVVEYNEYGTYVNNNSIMRFDDQQNLLWKYKYNTTGDKKNIERVKLLEKDEKYAYLLKEKIVKKDRFYNLLVLDMKTGNEISNKPITSLNKETLSGISSYSSYYYGSVGNNKTDEENVTYIGRYYDDTDRTVGFARFQVNKKTFEVSTKTFTYMDLVNSIPKITKNGGVEAGYFLDIRDIFILKDGSVGILMEKYKPSTQNSAPKTTDLVYIYTNSNFNVSGVKVFEKEKTKWANADYLFSQYLNDGKDIVFFYRDFQKDQNTKDKNWNLFINTFIDGKFKQEMIPISAKDNFSVDPYVAKEGYIMLQESNEKEKFNQIRLERLNY